MQDSIRDGPRMARRPRSCAEVWDHDPLTHRTRRPRTATDRTAFPSAAGLRPRLRFMNWPQPPALTTAHYRGAPTRPLQGLTRPVWSQSPPVTPFLIARPAAFRPPPPPCVTFRLVVAPLRGPGRSPVLPFACCVGSLLSVGRCDRCSCWCRFRVSGAQYLVCWGCAECGRVCRLHVSGAQ